MLTKVLFVTIALLVIAEASLVPSLHHDPQPYKFGYSVKDKHGEQHRQEVGDGHSGVKGSYGFIDDRGVQRQVNYVADHAGFRAQVKTNEPGTANQDPAAVNIISSAHPYYGAGYGIGGSGLGYGGAGLAGAGLGNGGAGLAGAGLSYGGAGLGGAGLGYGGSGLGGGGLGYRGAGLGAVGLGGVGVLDGQVGYGVPAVGSGLRSGYGYGLGYGSVTGYDSRYGAY